MWNTLSRVLAVALILAVALAVWLYRDDTHQRDAREELEGRVNELTLLLSRSKEQQAELTRRLERDVARLSREKEEEIAKLSRTHDDMVTSLKKEVEAGEVTITRIVDRLSLNIVDRLLFPSGGADISDDGRLVLERVGKILAQTQDKVIRIEGHTDNVPIGAALRARFPSNWELSTARATTVGRFLHENAGIDPAAIEAVGLGEYHPVAGNQTQKGRSQNRRIEIILFPRVRALAGELPVPKPADAGAKP
jgi:chemotaxis protein MotB